MIIKISNRKNPGSCYKVACSIAQPIVLIIYFLKYKTIETHARAFLPLNISTVGSVRITKVCEVYIFVEVYVFPPSTQKYTTHPIEKTIVWSIHLTNVLRENLPLCSNHFQMRHNFFYGQIWYYHSTPVQLDRVKLVVKRTFDTFHNAWQWFELKSILRKH